MAHGSLSNMRERETETERDREREREFRLNNLKIRDCSIKNLSDHIFLYRICVE